MCVVLFWADPESGDIVNSLPGATSWGDTVYMRDHAEIHHYVFANNKDDQARTASGSRRLGGVYRDRTL